MEESRNTMDNIENAETAINQGPPAGEPERQQYFMERAKRQLAELSARLASSHLCTGIPMDGHSGSYIPIASIPH